jgi:eukaryotic-like serine/threonine-protein kinase
MEYDRRAVISHPRLERGACVDRYIIVDELGVGGMGVVYQAFDPELGRPVALKLLHAKNDSSDRLRGRLLREAQALARVSHPNVIAVHDVGTVGDDVFIATEFVEGITLRRWLSRQPRSERQILDAFLAAGEGLSAAHRAGLVHRDFKPDNVMVAADGRVRVLDFGLARAAGGDDSHETPPPDAGASPPDDAPLGPNDATRERPPRFDVTRPNDASGYDRLSAPLTRAGSIMGTPRFMAPEQRIGAAVDERADQFSFCLALYEALVGEFPFAGESVEELDRNVLDGRMRELPATARVPRWLVAVLVRGMSVDPAARWPSMQALLAALRADPRVARRGRLSALAVVLVLGAAVATLRIVQKREIHACAGAESKLAGIWDAPRRAAIRAAFDASGKPYAADARAAVERLFDDYTRRWVAMHIDACEATNVRRDQSQETLDLRMTCLDDRLLQLATLSNLYAAGGASTVEHAAQSAASLPGLELCADSAALRAPVAPPADRAAREKVEALRHDIARANALGLAAQYDEALRVIRGAVGEAASLHYPPIDAEAERQLGQLLGDRGEFPEAAAALHRAFVAALAGHHEEAAARAAIDLISATGERQAHYDDADRWSAVAEALVGRLQRKDELEGILYTNRSLLRDREGKYDDALADATRALASKQRTFGPGHYTLAASYHQLGNIHESRSEWAQALDSYRAAYDIERRTLGPDHPMLIKSRVGMADVYGESGEHERALAMYESALVDFRRVQADHPSLPMVYNNMAEELQALARPKEAMAQYQRAYDIWQKQLGPSFETTVALNNMGQAQLSLGQPTEALGYFIKAQEVCERVLGPRHSRCGLNLGGLGEAYRRLGKLDAAIDCFMRARSIIESSLGDKNVQLVPALVGIGRVQLARHAAAAASLPLSRALAIRQADPGDGVELAEVRFALAQAIVATDRPRALALATQARDAWAKAGARHVAPLAEATAWLAHQRAE